MLIDDIDKILSTTLSFAATIFIYFVLTQILKTDDDAGDQVLEARVETQYTHRRRPAEISRERLEGILKTLEDRCPICFEDLSKPFITECLHIFCRDCVNELGDLNLLCPICRRNLAPVGAR